MRSHEKLLECDICQKYVKPLTLKKHKALHNLEENEQCQTCPKKFKTTESLRAHELRIHAEIKKKLCNTCNKLVVSLEQHILVHTGQKPL